SIAMAKKETIRERQENELEVIKSIFHDEVEDLRPRTGKWKPLELRLHLTPQRGSAKEAYVKADLYVTCSPKYPKCPPKLELKHAVGLSDSLVRELTEKLEQLADELKGEVMIFELANTVQAFLHQHNVPPKGSFYDEMLANQQKQALARQNTLQAEETLKRQAIQDELQRRKKELERTRRESRHSTNESSPMHRLHSSSSTENSDGAYCVEHRRSEVLYFRDGRKVLRGSCLGHSQRGCIAYAGIDQQTGELVYLTEWTLYYDGECSAESRTIRGRPVETVVGEMERLADGLIPLKHKHLIAYEGVLCRMGKEALTLFVVQEFILGTSLFSISGSLGWSVEGASMVAKGTLEALIYLHNNGVSHDNLSDSTVFMDNAGMVRVADFRLIPYIQELSDSQHLLHQSLRSPDLPSLGGLIEALLAPHSEMKDFVERCKSERTISATELLDHPFLRSTLLLHTDHVAMGQQQLTAAALQKALPAPTTVGQRSENGQQQQQQQLVPYMPLATSTAEMLAATDTEGEMAGGGTVSSCDWSVASRPKRRASRVRRTTATAAADLVKKSIEDKNIDCFVDFLPNDTSSEEDEDDEDDDETNDLDEDSSSSSSDESSGSISNHRKLNEESFNDSSGGIEFVGSNGEAPSYNSYGEAGSAVENGGGKKAATTPAPPEVLYMYIQMEFCEKSTLRTAIDAGLYQDIDRVWRLIKHQNGMPVRERKVNDAADLANLAMFLVLFFFSATPGQMGHLAVASIQQGKSSQPLNTGMERVKTLMDLRSDAIRLPEALLTDARYSRLVQVIRWLLNHDPQKRPTAEEVLCSELVPRTRLEAEEIQDVVRHILSNPQSRHYKHLIARCFAQASDPICELSYHFDMVPMIPILPRFDYVKAKLVALFRKHGAIEVVTPLLTPYTKQHAARSNTVKLMTHSGSVVTLPDDLRVPFLRHIALNGIKHIRRYSIGRVYREKKVFNFHPKQVYECAFDIVTPSRGHLITDAELLAIATDVMRELNLLQGRNVFFRLNHIGLLRAILMHCNVPMDKYRELFEMVAEFLDEKISKFQLSSLINSLIGGSAAKINVSFLCDALQLELSSVGLLGGSILKSIIRGKGEAASLAKVAVRELETVVTLAQNMGVQCPLNVCPGLPVNYERAKTGGIVWQLLGELKPKRKNPLTTIAVGGRYDGKLAEFQKSGINNGLQVPKVDLSGAGFSFLLDKLVNAIAPTAGYEPIEVMICVTGSRPQPKEVAQTLRPLWSNSIKTCVVETSAGAVDDLGKEAGATVVVLLGDGGEMRVRSWNHDRFQELHVTRPELMPYILRTLRRSDVSTGELSQALQSTSLGGASTSASSSAASQQQSINTSPPLDLVFLTSEKINTSKKRRYEHQVEHKMSPVLSKFHRKEKVTLIMVDVPSAPLRGLVGLIDPLECGSQEDDDDIPSGSTTDRVELQSLCERYPKYKRQLMQIYNEIVDLFAQSKGTTPIVGLYSVIDTFCRLIL
ncbi:AGAP012368-PA, partial [Anopheles gambiae str. PEST]